MQQNLKMVFVNASSALITLTVPGVKDGLTGAEVASTMDAIIANDIFSSTGGNLISKKAASVVQTDTTEIALA